jgi:O-methyltransferase
MAQFDFKTIARFPWRALRRALRPVRRALRPVSARCTRLLFEWRSRHREYLSRQLLFDTVVGFVDDCKIEGSYLEFGCAGGGSLIDIFHSVALFPRLSAMQFYVFDSFEGLPEPSGLDGDEFRRYEKGEFACDLDRYKKNVRKGGVDLKRVRCIQGWYDKTLTQELKEELPIQKASIVLIDCDLYESTVPVLDFIADYMQNGTVLIFDDWFSYKGRLDRGEAKAFKEWLAKNPSIQATEYHKAGRTMTSFIVQVD